MKYLIGFLAFLAVTVYASESPIIWSGVCSSGAYNLYTQACLSSGGGGVSGVAGAAPITSTGGANPVIGCNVASGSQAGCLASTDYATFASKQAPLPSPSPSGLVLGTNGTNYVLVSPQSGPSGPPGPSGLVNAIYPLSYNSGTQTVSIASPLPTSIIPPLPYQSPLPLPLPSTLVGPLPYQSPLPIGTLTGANGVTVTSGTKIIGSNAVVSIPSPLPTGLIPALPYLPLAGGTLTGPLNFTSNLSINSSGQMFDLYGNKLLDPHVTGSGAALYSTIDGFLSVDFSNQYTLYDAANVPSVAWVQHTLYDNTGTGPALIWDDGAQNMSANPTGSYTVNSGGDINLNGDGGGPAGGPYFSMSYNQVTFGNNDTGTYTIGNSGTVINDGYQLQISSPNWSIADGYNNGAFSDSGNDLILSGNYGIQFAVNSASGNSSFGSDGSLNLFANLNVNGAQSVSCSGLCYNGGDWIHQGSDTFANNTTFIGAIDGQSGSYVQMDDMSTGNIFEAFPSTGSAGIILDGNERLNIKDNFGNAFRTDPGGTYNTMQLVAPQGLEMTYVQNVSASQLLVTDSSDHVKSTNVIPNVYSYDSNVSAAVTTQSMAPSGSGAHAFEIMAYLSTISGSGTRTATITFTWLDPTNGFQSYAVPAFTISSGNHYSMPVLFIGTGGSSSTNISWSATYAGSGTGTYNAKIFMRQIE